MQVQTAIALAAALLSGTAFAFPAALPNGAIAARQAAESLHVMQCRRPGRTDNNSGNDELIYCASDNDCDHVPADKDRLVFDPSTQWIGHEVSGTFSISRVFASVTVSRNVWNVGTGEACGTAYNSKDGWKNNFIVYKDNGRVMYQSGELECRSIYYMLRRPAE